MCDAKLLEKGEAARRKKIDRPIVDDPHPHRACLGVEPLRRAGSDVRWHTSRLALDRKATQKWIPEPVSLLAQFPGSTVDVELRRQPQSFSKTVDRRDQP